MAECVLDASAVLAFLQEEPGSERVASRITRALISSVNLSEVVGKLADRGMRDDDVLSVIAELGLEVRAVDGPLGLRAGLMRRETRALGLSLGDRVCLALAAQEDLPVLTADRAWSRLTLPIEIIALR